jgi:hypothetical protein
MVIDGLEGEMYGNELEMYYIYKDNLPSIKKIALKLLQFGFFDDFRSKNGLSASIS